MSCVLSFRDDGFCMGQVGNWEPTSTASVTNWDEMQVAVGRGFCFDCDRPVEMRYHQWWFGDWKPPKTCLECGGHDVEFMGRVAERLWQQLQALKSLDRSLEINKTFFDMLGKAVAR